VFGVFVGSSPFGESIKSFLRIPPTANADIIQWKLTLLKGDENVLFFLNQHGAPLAGNAEFSYTLHRQASSASPPA
jgi:hypothetical protein